MVCFSEIILILSKVLIDIKAIHCTELLSSKLPQYENA